MDFCANDPGAVKYGNFINYYQFNTAEERIKLMPNDIWDTSHKPFIILDVGCNSGDLTQQLYCFLKEKVSQSEVIILGIDIDANLIKRAKEHNKETKNIFFHVLDIMNEDNFINNFLKSYKRFKFDALFLLSITMWIHLNHSDNGLMTFLQKCSAISELLVVEPQPWKCYQTAVRRMKRANKEKIFPNFGDLKWRNDIEEKIQEYIEGNLKRRSVYKTPPTKWKRKICFYR